VADEIGDANIVFSSDWPHKSLTAQATSLEEFLQRDDLSDQRKAAMACDNPRLWMDLGGQEGN